MWTYELKRKGGSKAARSVGGGYLLYDTRKPKCDFTHLKGDDTAFHFHTFIHEHRYEDGFDYRDDAPYNKKRASGTFNAVDFHQCDSTPYVLRRYRNEPEELKIDKERRTIIVRHQAMKKKVIEDYLTELRWQALLSDHHLAPKIYMVGRLMVGAQFELFCMMETKLPLSEKAHITTENMEAIEKVYHGIAHVFPDMTFVDTKYNNMVYDENDRFQAIDFDPELSFQDKSTSHHPAIRGDIMCYLFYVHLLLYGAGKLTTIAEKYAINYVHRILGKEDVVRTMWRWYHSGGEGEKNAFARIINCYSFSNNQESTHSEAFLKTTAAETSDVLEFLKDNGLSFLPWFQNDGQIRDDFIDWGYYETYAPDSTKPMKQDDKSRKRVKTEHGGTCRNRRNRRRSRSRRRSN